MDIDGKEEAREEETKIKMDEMDDTRRGLFVSRSVSCKFVVYLEKH